MSARGFAYVEVLIAAAILALCAVPAANAIRNGLVAGQAGQSKMVALTCVRNLMEKVMAEPYMNLNNAAGTSVYDVAANDNCAGRTVTIERKLFDGAKLLELPAGAGIEQKETALLKIKVAMKDSAYTFSTVVAQ